jgi:predicted transcriptional regulator
LQKRDRETITVDILEAASDPQKKTRIMYKANLNYVRFSKYFVDFIRKGFIVESFDSQGNPEYKISERGNALLLALKEARELAKIEKY